MVQELKDCSRVGGALENPGFVRADLPPGHEGVPDPVQEAVPVAMVSRPE